MAFGAVCPSLQTTSLIYELEIIKRLLIVLPIINQRILNRLIIDISINCPSPNNYSYLGLARETTETETAFTAVDPSLVPSPHNKAPQHMTFDLMRVWLPLQALAVSLSCLIDRSKNRLDFIPNLGRGW